MKSSIEFINHASVIIKYGDISILTDPWYEGDAFHKGWNLLHETNEKKIKSILNRISHIWISHEHPDHFSILFFKKFSSLINQKSIKILFQETKDKRVVNFLRQQSFKCEELKFNDKLDLSKNFFITCIKDGFYDSALLVDCNGEKILNLNDCDINSLSKIKKVKNITGEIDVLLTQFSFAAWKGGKNNKKWRFQAAKEKLNTIRLQIENFKPNITIPFASYIYFSNNENNYLNDAINTPHDVINELKGVNTKIIIMKPDDVFGGQYQNSSNIKALKFWKKKYDCINKMKINYYKKVTYDEISKNFKIYCERIENKNNLLFMKFLKILSPISIFNPVIIKLLDLKMIIEFDFLKKKIFQANTKAHLSMQSESLNFLFKNNFGFDTLTVNGCFEEEKEDGFLSSTKTLAIENLNNLGIYIAPKILLNFSLIRLFLSRLNKVNKKLK